MFQMWTQKDLNGGLKVANEQQDADHMRAGGAAIRARLAERQMTVDDVVAASQGGFKKTWLYDIMNGFGKDPAFFKLVLLGRILGWEPNELAEKFLVWSREKSKSPNP